MLDRMLDMSSRHEGRTSDGLPVSLTERPMLRLAQLSGWTGFDAAATALLERAGLSLPPMTGTSLQAGGCTLWRIAPDRVLIHGDCVPGDGSPELALLDLDSARRCWRIDGAGATDLLTRVIPLDLSEKVFPPGTFATTGIHGVAVLIDRTGPQTFDLYIPTTWAQYVVAFIALHVLA